MCPLAKPLGDCRSGDKIPCAALALGHVTGRLRAQFRRVGDEPAWQARARRCREWLLHLGSTGLYVAQARCALAPVSACSGHG